MTSQEKYKLFIEEMYRSFDFFNQKFAEGKLISPIITIQGGKNDKSVLGWFGEKFWIDKIDGNEENPLPVSEINLVAENLHREPNDVLETLLHEMAHYWNSSNDIKDCSSKVHNKHFKRAAEKFGLIVEKTEKRGWSKTSLDLSAIKAIEELQPKTELYQIFRNIPLKPKPEPKTINLAVGIEEFQEKIDYLLENHFENKRELAEVAVEMLYNKLKEQEEGKNKIEEFLSKEQSSDDTNVEEVFNIF